MKCRKNIVHNGTEPGGDTKVSYVLHIVENWNYLFIFIELKDLCKEQVHWGLSLDRDPEVEHFKKLYCHFRH